MIDFSDCMGDEEIAEYDPISEQPVIWGRRITRWLTEQEFDHLKLQHDVVTRQEIETVYFVVSKRIEWDALCATHGQPVQVGLGPRGGFKWVRMTNDTIWGHREFRVGAQAWVKNYPRFRVKCTKDGNSLQPSRRTIGRSSGGGNRRKR